MDVRRSFRTMDLSTNSFAIDSSTTALLVAVQRWPVEPNAPCTGLKFAAGNEYSLSETLLKLLSPSAAVNTWGANARLEYLLRYTPKASFEKLMQIYQFALTQNCNRAEAFNHPRQLEENS